MEVETLENEESDEIEPNEELIEDKAEETELDADAESQPNTDGFEEMELDGEVYQVPKALKEGYMKNADYTQKTTEVAQQRKELEEKTTSFQKMSEVMEQELDARAAYNNNQGRLEELHNVDWQAYVDQDPIGAQKLQFEYTQLQNEQQQIQAYLNNAYVQKTEAAKQETANRISAAKEYGQENIKGWSPDSYDEIVNFSINEQGFTREQLDSAMSPNVLKILHLAKLGSLSQKKQAAIPTLSQKAKATKPLKQVSSRSSGVSTKDPSDMSMSEYDIWSAKTFK
ncbi:hypothetical protein [Lentilitoribacter sp. Alg239-R112]|uniref:hypothetical protein n=1 Tax=Lentilitoribacter sp. Alg239-R112 TaxID=2305987 RepID=UPI0013A6EAA0|nr:hypothetical protein [Lentilitoribacter sp. Alg239-R112]